MIGSKFGFYHRFAVVAAADCRSTGIHSIDLTGSIHDVDRLVHHVIYRNRFADLAAAAVVAALEVGSVIYLALCELSTELRVLHFSVVDLHRERRVR